VYKRYFVAWEGMKGLVYLLLLLRTLLQGRRGRGGLRIYVLLLGEGMKGLGLIYLLLLLRTLLQGRGGRGGLRIYVLLLGARRPR